MLPYRHASLAINRSTARQLGLTIPASLEARAERFVD